MNFAYGELIMVGGYTMYFTQSWGFVPMVLATIVLVTLLSVALELVAFRPVRHATAVTLLATSFAVSFALQSLGWMTVGRKSDAAVSPYTWLTHQISIGDVRISVLSIATFVVAVALLIAMTLLIGRTRLGVQLRASTEDFRMAQLVGVRGNRVISAAFAVTGALAAVVALLFTLRTGAVSPDMGQAPLFVAFVGAVIGGLGSLYGAALGGFVLGGLISALEASLPQSINNYTELFAFAAVIAILVVLPDGLISVKGTYRRSRFAQRRSAAATTPEAAR